MYKRHRKPTKQRIVLRETWSTCKLQEALQTDRWVLPPPQKHKHSSFDSPDLGEAAGRPFTFGLLSSHTYTELENQFQQSPTRPDPVQYNSKSEKVQGTP